MRKHAGPESIRVIVVINTGLVLRTLRNDRGDGSTTMAATMAGGVDRGRRLLISAPAL